MAGDSKPILALAGPKNEDSHENDFVTFGVNGMKRNREAGLHYAPLGVLEPNR